MGNKKHLFFTDITMCKINAFRLQEREKELCFLRGRIDNIEKIFHIEEWFKDFIENFSKSMTFPDIACVKIIYQTEGQKETLFYESENFKDLKGTVIKAPITIKEKKIGEIIVGYTESIVEEINCYIQHFDIENTFLKDEQSLINSLGILISNILNLQIMTRDMKLFQESMITLSTPVMLIWDKILFLSLIGPIDSKRAQSIMEALLEKTIKVEAKFVIIDVQGIPVMDTAIANHLIKITKAIQLLGCKAILTGISATISQTLVKLGIDFNSFETKASPKEALFYVLTLLKANVINNK